MGRLSAGVARSVINPPVGIDLTGYAGRTGPNTGVHDDIHAKALVLSDGVTTGAIVTLDLLGLNARQAARVREDASRRSGIPSANILVGASHTHSGPCTQTLRACGTANEEFVSDLLDRIADTIVYASGHMEPAEFGRGSAETDIAINRRYRARDGSLQIGANEGGVTDPEVGIWSVRGCGDSYLAVVFNHPCHAVVLGNDNLLVSPDWPGAAQRAIEAAVGGQAMFLQGCCGNINPRDRGSFDVVEQVGQRAAQSVLDALPAVRYAAEAKLDIMSRMVDVPLQPGISREDAERIRDENLQTLRDSDASTQIHQVQLAQAMHDWAQAVLDGRANETSVSVEVQRFSLGGAHIIGLPGEVFVEYGLQIKALSPGTMVAAYANGNIGYVPTRKAFGEGGYEVDYAYKLYGEQMITDEAESLIISTAQELSGK